MRPVLKKIGELWGKFADLVGKVPAKRVDIGIAIVVTVGALVVYAFVVIGGNTRAGFAFLKNMEQRSLDSRFVLRGKRPIDDRVVIVGIDEKTLHDVGSWPISRKAYAQLVDKLHDDRAAIISFDVTFPTPEKNSAMEALKTLETEFASTSPAVAEKIRDIEKGSDNDAQFADSMKRAGNVILGHLFLDRERAKAMDEKAAEDYFNVLWAKPFPQVVKQPQGANFDLNKVWQNVTAVSGTNESWGVMSGIEANIRLLAEAARSYGYFNYVPDNDGVFRRAPFLMRYRDRDFFPSLALQTVREFENIKDQSIVAFMAADGMDHIEVGPHTIPTFVDGTALINYAGGYNSYPHYSMADVINGKVAPGAFKGKIVLVGATAVGIGDLRVTPFASSDYMGVEIHANVIDNMLNNDVAGRGFLKRGLNEEMVDIVFVLVFGLGMGFLFARLKPLQSTFSMVAAAVAYFALTYFAFSHWGIWLYIVIPAGTLVVNYGAITSFRMIFEEREKRKVRRTFERYVSPGVIRLIEQDPKKYFKTGGEEKELTIMFSDIRSFTSIAEGLTPDELVFLLNEYLGEMTDILFHRWGTLDKYIGDAMMGFWGSPFPQTDHASRACAAALDMGARLEELNLKWEIEGRKQLEIGIGINTGVVNVGNMGSSKRFAWTVMGDHVNLASRLEGQNKQYHTARIISEFTHAQVKNEFVCRDLDRIQVKGKLKPVKIYELMAFAKNEEKYRDLLTQWNDATAAYYRQSWDEAIQKFEALLSRYPDDGPAHTFLKRSHEKRMEAPDPTWNGVFVAKEK